MTTTNAPSGTGPTVAVTAALIDQACAAVQKAIATKQITAATIMSLLTTAMTEVEKIAGLTGAQKKELVVQVVDRLIDEIPGSTDKSAIKAAADLLLPGVIDVVVDAANGNLGLGQPAGGAGAAPCAGCSGCVLV